MKRPLILTCCLVLLFTLILTITGERSAAHNTDRNSFAAMLKRDLHLIDGAWCWRHLCPGKTTAEQARELLTDGVTSADPYDAIPTQWRPSLGASWSVKLYFDDDELLYFVSLISDNLGRDFLPQVTLAEVVTEYGTSVRVNANPDQRSVIMLCYAQGLCVRTLTWGRPQIRPFSRLDTISLLEPQHVLAHTSQFPLHVGWQGFADYRLRH